MSDTMVKRPPSILDIHIDHFTAMKQPIAALMVSSNDGVGGLEDLLRNTLESDWAIEGGRRLYRGIPIELHDEWAWGWTLRGEHGELSLDAVEACKMLDRAQAALSEHHTIKEG